MDGVDQVDAVDWPAQSEHSAVSGAWFPRSRQASTLTITVLPLPRFWSMPYP